MENENDLERLLDILQKRFDSNMNRHEGLSWKDIRERLESDQGKLMILSKMEATGGEPDAVGYDEATGEYIFFDCSPESPQGRRSLCYDVQALESRFPATLTKRVTSCRRAATNAAIAAPPE